jgi:hypothetical protein
MQRPHVPSKSVSGYKAGFTDQALNGSFNGIIWRTRRGFVRCNRAPKVNPSAYVGAVFSAPTQSFLISHTLANSLHEIAYGTVYGLSSTVRLMLGLSP